MAVIPKPTTVLEEQDDSERREGRTIKEGRDSHESTTPAIRDKRHQDDGSDLTDLEEGGRERSQRIETIEEQKGREGNARQEWS